MKQKLLPKTMLLLCALVVGGVSSAWAGNVTVLSEDFSTNNTTTKLTNAGWSLDGAVSLQSGWLQIASGSGAATATTPAFSSLVGNTAVMTFKIISASSTNSYTLTITGVNCKVDGGTSTTKTAGTSESSVTINITNASTNSKITFSASKSKGCRIDDLNVYYVSSTPSSGANFTNKTPSISWPTNNTYTQTANTATGYLATAGASLTYSIGSTNTCGASIDASTGEVTVTKGGSVIVIATAAAIDGQFTQSSDNYTLTVNDVRADAGLSWSESAVEILKDATTYTLPTLNNPNNLTINNYTVTGTEGIASVTNTGVVTVNTGTVGTATIKAIFGGNNDYKSQTVSYTITIVDPTVKGTKYNPYTVDEIIALFAEKDDYTNNNVYVTGYIIGACNGTNGNLLETIDTNTNIAIHNSPTGTSSYCIIQLSSNDHRESFGAQSKPYNIGCAKILVKGNIQKYCTKPGVKSLSEASIVEQHIKITSAGLATYCTDVNLTFDGDLEAYIAKEESGAIKLYQVTNVPANTGILLRAPGITADSYFDVNVTTDADNVTGNLFVQGADAAVASGTGPFNYVLSKKSGVVGFYRANNKVVAANRAYLQTTIDAGTNAPALAINFGDEGTTGIVELRNQMEEVREGIFDLSGRRVENPTKGLYIVNGKKVIIK